MATRAIAGDDQLQVNFGASKPELDGNLMTLPEPSRLPSAREIAVIRGWADSLALTSAMHDAKLHKKIAPEAGAARTVFEAVERARVEALGANRMPGMAKNLTAKVEEQYGHARFAAIKERADAPLEDALALLVREKLTGLAPPETARRMVDLWRPFVEEKSHDTLAEMGRLAEDQAGFGKLMRNMLRQLDLIEELAEGEASEGEDETQENPDGGEEESDAQEEGGEGDAEQKDERMSEAQDGEFEESAESMDTDQFDAEGDEEFESDEPWRPGRLLPRESSTRRSARSRQSSAGPPSFVERRDGAGFV